MALCKIVVVSDTHGNVKALEQLRGIFFESDYIIHLGDGAKDMKEFYSEFGNKIYQVDGNCDVFCTGLKEFVLDVGKIKILLTHGDCFGVKSGLDNLISHAKALGCKIALYGHTHNAEILERDGVLTLNPGSLSYFTAQKSIGYIVINGEKAVASINKRAVKN